MAKETMATADQIGPIHSDAEWDAQGWAAAPVPVTAAPRLATTLSVRFESDSAHELRRAARLSELSMSEFVRRAAMSAAQSTIASSHLPKFIFRALRREPAAITTTSIVRHVLMTRSKRREKSIFSLAEAGHEQ